LKHTKVPEVIESATREFALMAELNYLNIIIEITVATLSVFFFI